MGCLCRPQTAKELSRFQNRDIIDPVYFCVCETVFDQLCVYLSVSYICSVCDLHTEVIKRSLLGVQRFGDDNGAYTLLNVKRAVRVSAFFREKT